MKLLETVVAVGILALILAGFGAFWLGRKSYAVRNAVATFSAIVDDARAVAQTSGDGATIAVASDGKGGFTASVYPYRPIPGANLGAASVRSSSASVALAASGIASAPPFALFVSSSGTVSAAAWTPANGTLTAEPACSGAIALTFDDGFLRESHAVPCASATLR